MSFAPKYRIFTTLWNEINATCRVAAALNALPFLSELYRSFVRGSDYNKPAKKSGRATFSYPML